MPDWDDIQILTARRAAPPRLEDEPVGTEAMGEGGMLPEEWAANSRYYYVRASGRLGFSWDKLDHVQSRIAEVRDQEPASSFGAPAELIQVLAQACGHDPLSKANREDLTTWKKDLADRSDISHGGLS